MSSGLLRIKRKQSTPIVKTKAPKTTQFVRQPWPLAVQLSFSMVADQEAIPWDTMFHYARHHRELRSLQTTQNQLPLWNHQAVLELLPR